MLEIVKYNKNIQKRLEKDINDYKIFKKINIEIIPINLKKENIFINPKYFIELFDIYFNMKKKKKKQKLF